MKQILQNLKSGRTELVDVPAPQARAGHLLVATRRSLISAGTERMLVEFGRANLLQKARSQPDKVKQVLDKIRTDGLLPTLEAVFKRLDEPLPLGYCNVSTIQALGERLEAKGFSIGDRVASNGPHAEIVGVPKNLRARIPEVFGAGLIGLAAVLTHLRSKHFWGKMAQDDNLFGTDYEGVHGEAF